ncbi:MAG TPA: hypothetical protein DHW42_11210 [Candidatus Marinimicrobia bacterium]|nr:hypothetical protein [Candidatus Neomarinimicrobiota bacterium]
MQQYDEMLKVRRYSQRTADVYLHCFRIFLDYFYDQDIYTLTKNDIIKFDDFVKSPLPDQSGLS